MVNMISRMKYLRWTIFGSATLASVFLIFVNHRAQMHFPFPGVDNYTQHSFATGQQVPKINFSFNVDPRWRCRGVDDLFAVIISAPANWEKRRSIRRTWLRHLERSDEPMNAGYAFLIGTTNDSEIQGRAMEESAIHGDILQVDSVDTYRRLSLKTVAMLQWTLRHCQSKFILKVDDDIYVNVRNLGHLVLTLPPENRTVYGTVVKNSMPIRDPNDKWRISYEAWPWSTYPPYVSGSCYLLSRTAVEDLLDAAKMTPYFAFEDVYLSGLCAIKAGVSVVTSSRMVKSDAPSLVGQEFANGAITWQTNSISQMWSSHSASERLLLYENELTPGSLGDLGFRPLVDDQGYV